MIKKDYYISNLAWCHKDFNHVSKLLTKYDTMLFFSDETYKRINSKHRDNTSARYTYLKSGLIGIRKTANSVAFFDRYKYGVQ